MYILKKISLDNDVILVLRKLGQKLITLQDFINLHNVCVQTTQQLHDQLGEAATVCANQLNDVLSGWGFLIGSRQRWLQPAARKVLHRVQSP